MKAKCKTKEDPKMKEAVKAIKKATKEKGGAMTHANYEIE